MNGVFNFMNETVVQIIQCLSLLRNTKLGDKAFIAYVCLNLDRCQQDHFNEAK